MHELLPTGRRLGIWTLTALIYFTACGGAFGMEPLVSAVGPGWSVVLIILTPIVYSLPIALMSAELVSLLPDEGGCYVWVRESFGRFWAVQEAWWTLIFGLFYLASYPVLFVAYLGYVLAHLGGGLELPWLATDGGRWAVALAVIAGGLVVNLLGARDVGRSAVLATGLVLGSFGLFLGAWWLMGGSATHAMAVVSEDLRSGPRGALLLGLSVLVFNYGSWDKVATYAGEVDHPQRAYPVALGIALLATLLSYLLPVLAGIDISTEEQLWTAEAGWPVIAARIGGRALGVALAAGGMISMVSLYNASLLWVSRLPAVLAEDGWLPRWMGTNRGAGAVPVGSLVLVSVVIGLLAAASFADLVVVQTLFYMGALVLEFLALIRFRRLLPDAPRAFRVPGGTPGLWLTTLPPMAFGAAVVYATFRDADSYAGLLAACVLLLGLGIAMYLAGSRVRRRPA